MKIVLFYEFPQISITYLLTIASSIKSLQLERTWDRLFNDGIKNNNAITNEVNSTDATGFLVCPYSQFSGRNTRPNRLSLPTA